MAELSGEAAVRAAEKLLLKTRKGTSREADADLLAAEMRDRAIIVSQALPDVVARTTRRAYLFGGRVADVAKQAADDARNHLEKHPFQRSVIGSAVGTALVVGFLKTWNRR